MTANASGPNRSLPARVEALELGLRELTDRIGESPDPVTKTPGSGLSAAVAELVRVTEQRNNVVIASAAGAGGAMALTEGVLWLVRLLGLG